MKPNTKYRGERKASRQALSLIRTEADEGDGKLIQQGTEHSLPLSKHTLLPPGAT